MNSSNPQESIATSDQEPTTPSRTFISILLRSALSIFSARTLGLLSAAIIGNASAAKEDRFAFYFYFHEPEDFLSESFNGNPPAPAVLQFDNSNKEVVREVFERYYPAPRIRYWSADGYTAWIFDDVGKEGYQPTTSAFLVKDGQIIDARVLVYRESRGQEVGEEFFLEQLEGARSNGKRLTQEVDAITGATESVYMMQRMARTAIALDGLVD
ncbi:MAG: FMN-binding protein [Pseudomonadota bacterium]|nr:FMN-binding protein [Pseudomonadota bacterium]